MFQFPAFAPLPCAEVTGSLPPGCPIRRSAAITGICPSPRLFAACHVLLRLREPRHPPCALFTTCFSFSRKRSLFQNLLFSAFFGFGFHPALPPFTAGRRRRSLLGLCLTLGLISRFLGLPAHLSGQASVRFQPCHCPLSFWVVRGRVELPTSTLSV